MAFPKPHIWKRNGIWYCGFKDEDERESRSIVRKGRTPTKAYDYYKSEEVFLLWSLMYAQLTAN